MARATNFSMISSSANLDKEQVSDIGLRCMSVTVLSFGTGVTLTNFHTSGRFWSWKELFKRTETGYARISAMSLKIRFGILSGQGAFEGLKDMSFR